MRKAERKSERYAGGAFHLMSGPSVLKSALLVELLNL